MIFNYNFSLRIGSKLLEVKIKSHAKSVLLASPSGTGKTSILKVIAGIHSNFIGDQPANLKIGYVPQEPLLIPTLTVQENIMLSPRANPKLLLPIAKDFMVDHLLCRRPRNLSGGEKQRASIVRAIMCDPELMLLDEPFSALDQTMKTEVVSKLFQYQKQMGYSILLVSHDESKLNALCDETWAITQGQVKLIPSENLSFVRS